MEKSAYALRQLGAAPREQTPGFEVAFIAVASLLRWWDDWAQHRHGEASCAQQQGRRDQIPGVHWNHVRGEQVDLIEGVVALFQEVGFGHAAIARAYS